VDPVRRLGLADADCVPAAAHREDGRLGGHLDQMIEERRGELAEHVGRHPAGVSTQPWTGDIGAADLGCEPALTQGPQIAVGAAQRHAQAVGDLVGADAVTVEQTPEDGEPLGEG
jgi:hypothetical protein